MGDLDKAIDADSVSVTPQRIETFGEAKFASMVKLITRDLNARYGRYVCNFIGRFKKEL